MFVSRETQEKIDHLEREKAELEAQLGEIRAAKPKSNSWIPVAIAGWIAFLLAGAFIVYTLYFAPGDDPYAHIPITTSEGMSEWRAVPDSGIAYHVQIGAFREFDLTPYQAELGSVYLFKNDSLQRITLGRFVRFTEAQEFQEKVVELGLDFAYITAYKDGEAIGLLHAIRQENQTE